MTDETEEAQPPEGADYYTILCALAVHVNRYLGCKVKAKDVNRSALRACLNRIYQTNPEIQEMAERAMAAINTKIRKGSNGSDY